ncbi:Uu.00g057870.m01.CDS01 [Anthostomella pinea]|uniref:Uu.00g057870.m01.CDS01 n=1 Tax=Anthostomella pinea TaxID=933095 RepID=A0AAI8YM65_9PEZI|nr:Uu.00g057870.m01.CDS01 [Anthostomella pinea]
MWFCCFPCWRVTDIYLEGDEEDEAVEMDTDSDAQSVTQRVTSNDTKSNITDATEEIKRVRSCGISNGQQIIQSIWNGSDWVQDTTPQVERLVIHTAHAPRPCPAAIAAIATIAAMVWPLTPTVTSIDMVIPSTGPVLRQAPRALTPARLGLAALEASGI